MTPWFQKWRELRHTFTHTPQALQLVWQTNRWATGGLGLLTVGGALLPATQAWVGKLIVDGVVASIQNGSDPARSQTVFLYLILELILFLLSAGINQGRRLIQQLIQLQLANRIRGEIIRKALTMDLAFFEHPDFYDRLQNARREGGYKPMELINDTFQIVQNSHHDDLLRRIAAALQSLARGDFIGDQHSGVHRAKRATPSRDFACSPGARPNRGRSIISRAC